MKKLFLLPLSLLFFQVLNAQISGVGIRPGVSLSTFKLNREYNDIYNASLRPGMSMAAFMEINLGNRFTLQPEVAFTQRGANLRSKSTIYWDGPAFGYPADYRVVDYRQKETLNYLDVPLMVEKNFGGGNVGAYVALGPGLSFGFKGKGREEITYEFPVSDGQIDIGADRFEYGIEMGSGRFDTYKGFDFSLNAGAGLLFLLENGEIGIDLRYTHGLKNLNVDGLKNRNLLVGVSYMHYIGQ
ncbi:MAG: PorT family protein [Saprospiraceae bacterium]|nr:PorT family protein [Saprospiraceae bacterium]